MNHTQVLKIVISLSAALTLLVSCSTMNVPGGVKMAESSFDNTKELTVQPGWVGSNIKLGLFKNSKMPKEQVVLSVVVMGARPFGAGKNLKMNIDGQIYEFESLDKLTGIETKSGSVSGTVYVPSVNESTKNYIIGIDLVEKLNSAKSAIVKVELDKSYVEGDFSSGGYTTAKPGFKEFMTKTKELY